MHQADLTLGPSQRHGWRSFLLDQGVLDLGRGGHKNAYCVQRLPWQQLRQPDRSRLTRNTGVVYGVVCARSPHASTLCQHMWNARISCATQWVSTLPGSSMQAVSVGSWYNPQGSGTSQVDLAAESGRRSSMLRLPAEWRCLHPRYCFSVCTCVGWVSRSRFLRAALAIARADFRSALCLRLFAVFRRQTVGEHGGMRWPGRVGFAAVQGPLRLHRSARGWAPCAAVEATTGHALQAADGGSDAPSRTWKHNVRRTLTLGLVFPACRKQNPAEQVIVDVCLLAVFAR